MNQLSQIPLARIVLPLVTGIAFGLWLPMSLPDGWFYGIVILSITTLAFISYKGNKYAAWFGFAATLFFVLVGIKLVDINRASNKPNYFGNWLNARDNIFAARIIEPPQEKAKSIKALLVIESIKQGKNWKHTSGTLLAYFAPDNTAGALAYGDRLLIHCPIENVTPPTNPGQFNNKTYLANKGIYNQAYIKPEDYTVIESNVGNNFYAWVYKVRARLLWQLRESGLHGQELAVASALLLGYDDDIENNLLQAYSASGTMHVLSVSGMHAGLVYLVFMWLLQFAGQSLAARITRAIILISVLWIYALLTGFSPPVIRAAAMFSMLALGQSLNRYTNTINILAGSCLLMLLFNPFLLADVGFQLSYIAVFGIALLYQPMYSRLEFTGYIADKIWQITAMSIVAQLATFPLSLLYFHQFPNYFIFSNLIIIPLSSVVIFVGIALLCVSFMPVIANVVALLLNKLIYVLNRLVLSTEQLPFAVVGNIKISVVEMFTLYFIITAFAVAFFYKKKQWLYTALITSVILCAGRVCNTYRILHQQRIVVYNTNKAVAIEYISGKNSVLLADSSALPGTINYNFNLGGALWYYGVDNRQLYTTDNKMIFNKHPLTVFGNTKLLLVDGKINTNGIGRVDYIIISGNPYLNFDELQKLKPKLIILGPNNKPQKLKYWQKEFEKRGVKYHNVGTKGAFIVNL